MKRYKLLKDLPCAKAGEIFERKIYKSKDGLSDCDHFEIKKRVEVGKDEVVFGIKYNFFLDNFDEWFEELKEFKEWSPFFGQWYKYLDELGDASKIIREHVCDMSDLHVSTGNCYPLDTPDEVIIKERKLIPQAMHRLKMAAKKAWFEFDGSEDWDMEFVAYYIARDLDDGRMRVCTSDSVRAVGVVYFPTEESAQAYIDNNEDDLKLLFGEK